MKKSVVAYFCGFMALAGIFHSCSKEDFSDPSGTFTDLRDNKEYEWVRIGDQVWMAENLAFLPSVNPESEESYTDPYYYVYDYQGNIVSEAKATDNYSTYGVLYNWPAALVSCPAGWHLPTDDEWTELENYLIANGNNYDGTTTENKIAKASATSYGWTSSSETGAIGNTDYPEKRNLTGFTALPGGIRGSNGAFYGIRDEGYWWSATESNTYNAWSRITYYYYSGVFRCNYFKEDGFSVRCLRDEAL